MEIIDFITTEKKAYELGGVSIGFIGKSPLGDAIIYKKVFDALIILEPECHIDILCMDERSKINSKAFYSGSKNLNSIINYDQNEIKKYDLTLLMEGGILILNANEENLQRLSPKLYQSILKLDAYNRRFVYPKDFGGRFLFEMARARILKKNIYTLLARDGAFPISDNKVEIKLLPEWQKEFDKLGLKKYITVGSNGGKFGRHMVKEWSTRYWIEFISMLKSKMPDIQVVQSGGGGVEKFENADRHLLGTDLELTKYILKNSLLHIDIEGGPVHLASQLGTKCVVLFGATDVQYYGFSKNINIVSEVCSPCLFAWDSGTECLLGGKEPLCMLSITPQKVFEVAYRYLKSLE